MDGLALDPRSIVVQRVTVSEVTSHGATSCRSSAALARWCSVAFVLRLAVVLGLALPLAAADLAWKQAASTPTWAYHGRSVGWLLLSIVLVEVTLALARVR